MKRVFLLSFILLSCAIFAQVNVVVSTEKVRIDNEVFYVHKIEKGQTLYSIGKAYNIDLISIIKQNPDAESGLKTGSILYIPTAVKESQPSPEPTKNTPISSQQKYQQHRVKWFEDIETIASSYGVNKEAILHLNNLDTSSKLKWRMILLIPDSSYVVPSLGKKDYDEKAVEEKNIIISFPNNKVDDIVEEEQTSKPKAKESTFVRMSPTKISLILPFNAENNTDSYSVNMMDFYSGVLLSLQDSGIKYELNTIDLSKYSSTQEMLLNEKVDDSELIIGPIITDDLQGVAEFAKSNKIPIVSPMDDRTEVLLEDNPYLFLFPSPAYFSQDNLVDEFIKVNENDSTKNTIIFEKGTDLSKINELTTDFASRNIEYSTFSYSLLDGRGIDSVMFHKLDSVYHNKVYLASESEAFVADVLRNLHLLQASDTLSISVYGPGRWRNFSTLEPEYLHHLNTRFSLRYDINYSDEKTSSFVNRYWKIFKADPSPYSFQGYDIILYFLPYIDKYGKDFSYYFQGREQLLQSDVEFIPISPNSGFINKATRNIVYMSDWEIKSGF